jgi:hypothetical protein
MDHQQNDYEEDMDDIDFDNYKGIYHGDKNNEKYTCPETGAHFKHSDICMRLDDYSHKIQQFEQDKSFA